MSNRADLRERTKTINSHGDRRGRNTDFRDSFERIKWLYLLSKCGIKTKTHFEWVLWHCSSLCQLNLVPTWPNGLVGCKVTVTWYWSMMRLFNFPDYPLIHIHVCACKTRVPKYREESGCVTTLNSSTKWLCAKCQLTSWRSVSKKQWTRVFTIQSHDRLIFIIGISIPRKVVFLLKLPNLTNLRTTRLEFQPHWNFTTLIQCCAWNFRATKRF